jgi:hypothetical protein
VRVARVVDGPGQGVEHALDLGAERLELGRCRAQLLRRRRARVDRAHRLAERIAFPAAIELARDPADDLER